MRQPQVITELSDGDNSAARDACRPELRICLADVVHAGVTELATMQVRDALRLMGFACQEQTLVKQVIFSQTLQKKHGNALPATRTK
jgi:hypothetical protein